MHLSSPLAGTRDMSEECKFVESKVGIIYRWTKKEFNAIFFPLHTKLPTKLFFAAAAAVRVEIIMRGEK